MIEAVQTIKPVAAFGHMAKFVNESEYLQALIHAHIFPQVATGNEAVNFPLIIKDAEFVNWLGGAKFICIFAGEFDYFLVTFAGGVISIHQTGLHSVLSEWMAYGAKIIAKEHSIQQRGAAHALAKLKKLRSELAR